MAYGKLGSPLVVNAFTQNSAITLEDINATLHLESKEELAAIRREKLLQIKEK